MKRLLANWRPELSERSRAEQAREFSRVYGHTLLLKGARTVIADAGRPLAYNSTGTPAMASGGMGDILTGMCAALLGQGLEPFEAGAIGSWVLGRAGELASPEGIGASFVLQHINAAFDSCRTALTT
jgi:NAD(P)H-hydrate epimerase